ncbi:helix-turn-helix transcriptional regulator [Labilibaculum sp. K2S]|uniref:helix-turn-helix domain-containing protein n=1 Tax=Labilibaculum sp. K2S TaxID=3056386 RepID=UPI0025A3A07E|nr:helix-turn-helix transcriptional regulator [Labilibaculum sp. K2S]MDM8160452.1 helix-turn-helix transcriptional regulator [Labilibaculum sp. K2S]
MELSVIERVKKIREDEKMSQKEFSEALGVSLGYIGGVETGRNPINHTFLASLKEKFNISADWLLFGEESIVNIEDSFKMALILDTSDREVLISTWSIYQLLKSSTDPEKIKAAQAIKDGNFETRHRLAWELGQKKNDLYRLIIKHLHLENKPLAEIAGIIQFYIETSVKMHNEISEFIDKNHEYLHGHTSFPYK